MTGAPPLPPPSRNYSPLAPTLSTIVIPAPLASASERSGNRPGPNPACGEAAPTASFLVSLDPRWKPLLERSDHSGLDDTAFTDESALHRLARRTMTTHIPRAFLSHSSLDKQFVAKVFEELGPTLAELDQATFEPGKFNHEAITRAMQRCGVFVLFASMNSLKSAWVAGEIKEALRRLADRRLSRIIVYCADKTAFGVLSPELKETNIVRVEQSPAVCARQIRGILAEVRADSARADLFIARDENLAELKRIVIDPSKNFRTVAISGFERLGRRALASRFCRDVYGSFNPPAKAIVIDAPTSPDDLYRQLLRQQYETLDRAELIAKVAHFSLQPFLSQMQLIGSEMRSIYDQREFLMLMDEGGIIADNGDFSNLFQSILAQNTDISDVMSFLILYRTPQSWVRRKYNEVAFYRLPPLTDAQAEVSLLHELKQRRANLPRETVIKLVGVCDGHPANLEYVIGYVFDGNTLNKPHLEAVISGSQEFANYKRERARSYVSKFPINELERLIVGALVNYKSLPAEVLAALGQQFGGGPAEVGDALARLYELNVLDSDGSQYRLIRPLRDALEREHRFDLRRREIVALDNLLLEIMESYSDGDAVPISLIEPGSVAAIKQGRTELGWARQFILPSHYIWLAREAYHGRDYRLALEYAQAARSLTAIMTVEAKLECLRFAGLACARLDMADDLSGVIVDIAKIRTKKAEGNKHFLLGFSARLRGDLAVAQVELVKASSMLRGSIDVERELISVHLARGDYPEALRISEALVRRAEDNPYALDGYLQAKIATAVNIDELAYDSDFSRRLERLEAVGDGPGLSFYCLRQTQIALKKGDADKALYFSGQAISNTPNLPAAHAAKARALIAAGKSELAWEAIQAVEELKNRRTRLRDGLENLLLYQIRFEYNQAVGRFDLCRKDIENIEASDAELARMIKRGLAHAVAKSGAKVSPALAKWLKT